eukprot:s1966_g7.t1
MLKVLVPIFLRRMLRELEQGTGSPQSLTPWAAAYSLCWVAVAIGVGTSQFQGHTAGLTMRIGIQRLIYSHCLKMPSDAVGSMQNPTNLMSIDADKPHQTFMNMMPHAFVLTPVLPALLVVQLGVVPAVVCVVTSLSTMYFSKRVGGQVSRKRRLAMVESDRRLLLVEQYLEGIRARPPGSSSTTLQVHPMPAVSGVSMALEVAAKVSSDGVNVEDSCNPRVRLPDRTRIAYPFMSCVRHLGSNTSCYLPRTIEKSS